MPRRKLTRLKAVPFTGGAVTASDRSQIPTGSLSWKQNLRDAYPTGFKSRKGMAEYNTKADGSNETYSLYQLSKGQRVESQFFAQMGDGDLLSASTDPPTLTGGGFGDEIFSGSSGQTPAAYSNMRDLMLYSNGADQHQVYSGLAQNVSRFIKYDASASPGPVPEEGWDYTKEVTDFLSTSYADISGLDTFANNECLMICCKTRANRLTPTMLKKNGATSTLTVQYHTTSRAWTDLSITDGSASGGATFGKTGTIYWTYPSDEAAKYMYGMSGYWYRLKMSASLDGEVQINAMTYGSEGDASGTRTSLTAIENVWDGYPPYAIEARMYDDSASVYYTYGSDNINVGEMTSSDKVYFNSFDSIEGFYVDVGDTPNTTASTTINAVYRWDGDSWAAVSGLVDGTGGLANSGWVTFDRDATEQKTQFQNAKYYSYWYYFTVDQTISASVLTSIETMPIFDLGDFGEIGYVNTAWKDRGLFSYNDQYLYVSAKGNPLHLNGDDFAILEAGDGRTNRVTAAKKFHNELMVWQEELGIEGGCLTLFEGYSPATFGKLVLSSKLGTFSPKTVDVVDGVLTSTRTDEIIKTLAFFISHYGICVTDGRTASIISDDIRNYFDPKESVCIRRGYEDKMWLKHDSSDNVIRVGLVSGATATLPNVFPVFDLATKSWSFDTPDRELSCIQEVQAASGQFSILQYGGGIDDGKVYQLNTTTNDVGASIDSHVVLELNAGATQIHLRRLQLQVKSQSAGNVEVTPYRNGVAGTQTDLTMVAENSNEESRTHIIGMPVQSKQISLKIGNDTVSQEVVLQKIGVEIHEKERH